MNEKIVLASNNPGKIREIQGLLNNPSILPQARFDIPDVAETGLTFVENALIKARHAARISGLPAIADDSGLTVEALQGAPGIFSARFAGPDARDEDNVAKLLTALGDTPTPRRGARFVCVMVYLRHAEDPVPLIAQGAWDGSISFEPRGENGFGYDPVFYVEEQQCTAAQLAPETKNRLSHRGRAIRDLAHQLGVPAVRAGREVR